MEEGRSSCVVFLSSFGVPFATEPRELVDPSTSLRMTVSLIASGNGRLGVRRKGALPLAFSFLASAFLLPLHHRNLLILRLRS